jgi:hypothetical protein
MRRRETLCAILLMGLFLAVGFSGCGNKTWQEIMILEGTYSQTSDTFTIPGDASESRIISSVIFVSEDGTFKYSLYQEGETENSYIAYDTNAVSCEMHPQKGIYVIEKTGNFYLVVEAYDCNWSITVESLR